MKIIPNALNSTLSSPWVFFGLAMGWSWLFWISAILLGVSIETPVGLILGLLGLLGPMVAGITSTYLVYGKEGRRDYWLRIIDVRRIGVKWFLVIFLFVPILVALAVLLDILSGGSGSAWEEAAVQIFATPWMIIPIALSIFMVGPLEEFGWRGYAQDRLQARWDLVTSSMNLGIVWSLWHLPLFFIQDTYQYNLGAGSQSFWLFMVGILPLTFVFSWIFNNTNRSTLAAMLFHFMVNFTGELVALSPQAELYSIALWILVAIVIAVTWHTNTVVRVGSAVSR
jgi:membrane protease YdiL (CAAX protease family)